MNLNTKHAAIRACKRGIPPLIQQWLMDFGEESYDGHGGICRFFSHRSVRSMERCLGREPVRRMSEYLDAYLVESSHDGATITVGHRSRRIKRR
jgi:hypothetical protein